MCITPQHAQYTVLLKTFNPLLPAVLLIICLIPLGSAECPPGQFLHFNPETNKGVCCITVPLPIGYGFKSCEVNGTPDRIEKCPEGFYQPDNTTTESEATCSKEFECNQEEHSTVQSCVSGQNCVIRCVCNYEKGYCGKFFYDCKKFPKDCPSELVQRDCSCKRDPHPGNTSNRPGPTIITTPSPVPADGASKPTQENDKTKDDGDVGSSNGTADNNGTVSSPDKTQSTVPDAALITSCIVFGVGLAAVVILVYIFRTSLKKWLSKFRNFCSQNKSTNQIQVRSDDGYDDEKNLTGGQSEDRSKQAGGSNIQSLVIDIAGSNGCYGDQKNPAGVHGEGDGIQAGGSSVQSLVVDHAGSNSCYGDQKNPAGDHGEGDSIQAGGSSVQSLVVDHGKTGSQGIDTAGPFCSCCGRHWKRCNKHVIEQSLARVKPQQGVNGMRQTVQFLEIPSTGNVESEMSIDGYSSFTPSIYQDHESHDNTNAADEETTLLKPVSSPDDQISSIVQQISVVEGTRYEESQQAELDINEDHMTTGMSIGDHYRTDSLSGVMNHDEEKTEVA